MEFIEVENPPEMYTRLMEALAAKRTMLDIEGKMEDPESPQNVALNLIQDRIYMLLHDYFLPDPHPNFSRSEVNLIIGDQLFEDIFLA